MTDSKATLATVFKANEVEFNDSQRANIEKDQEVVSIKHSIVEDFSDQQWQVAVSEVAANLAGCLDTGIPDILLNAWKTTNELAGYCKNNAGDSVLVPLVKHEIVSEHHPAIEVFIKQQRIGKIPFTVKLRLKLEGFSVTVQDCRVKAINTGNCVASGTLKFNDMKIAEVESKKITLPGRIPLGEGIAIA